ncbi:hypothetical protein LTR85_009074 [Meristemomyces frigidus]|nr:hypothetical protein LTR85_009074 [Meristemomyces frigidus]
MKATRQPVYTRPIDWQNKPAVGGSLFAADTTTVYGEDGIDLFKQSIVNQNTWANYVNTPYVALFSDYQHAKTWALKMGDHTALLTTATAGLSNAYTFKRSTLLERLSFRIPEAASQHTPWAHLGLHHIPAAAIVHVTTVSEIQIAAAARKDSVECYMPYDCDDSDDEAAMNDCNDDMINMMEGDWYR